MIINNLKSLLYHFSLYPNLYILGAGCSYGIVPTTIQLKAQIIDRALSQRGFSIDEEEKSPIFHRVIDSGYLNNPKWYFVESLKENSIEWIVSEILANKHNISDQYKFFFNIPDRSVIFSYNLDGLANVLKQKHILLEPHGSIPKSFMSELSEDYLKDLIELNVPTPWSSETLIIKPEDESLFEYCGFEYLINIWPHFKSVIIIGYSFSIFDKKPDDYYSLQFLIELIRHFKTEVFLIDPFPDFTKYLIEKGIQRKINIIKYRWDILSKVINHNITHIRIQKLWLYSEKILKEYLLLLNEVMCF